MAEVLKVVSRDSRGKREAKRLRRSGSTPAVLYGHGEANVALSLASDAIAAAVRHGARVVELSGVVNEKALIRELQWDTYGIDVLHVDFARVSEHERVQLEVKVELRGQAPGIKEGGIVELLVHELEIDCEALSIPEKIEVNVKDLHLNGQIHAADIKLPDGVKLLTDGELLVAQCVVPAAEEDLEAGEATGAEPEVIGRKADEEGEGDE